jgi:hypothetical protein
VEPGKRSQVAEPTPSRRKVCDPEEKKRKKVK